MGIAGDRTRHLQWRINHGELDSVGALKVVVLLIGVNNLNYQEHTPRQCKQQGRAVADILISDIGALFAKLRGRPPIWRQITNVFLDFRCFFLSNLSLWVPIGGLTVHW